MGQLAPAPEARVLTSLGAGDALGRIVYVNDTVLALGGNPAEFWAMHRDSGSGANALDPMTTIAAAMELRLPVGIGADVTREGVDGIDAATFVNVPEPGDLP